MCLPLSVHSHKTSLYILESSPQMKKPRLREMKPLLQVPSGPQPRPRAPLGVCSAPARLGAHPPSPPLAHGPLLSSSTGPDPSEETGTKALFRLSDAMEEGAWAAVVVDQQDSTLSLQFSTPANAPIGHYRLSLEASTGYQGSSFMLAQFTLLFNSWCPGELHCVRGQDGKMGRAGPTHGNHLVAGW